MATLDTELAPDEAPENAKPKFALETKVDAPSACQRHVTVTVARDDIERYFREAFDDLAPKAKCLVFVPGGHRGSWWKAAFASRCRSKSKARC